MRIGGKKSHDDFQFGTFVDRFPSDGAASVAVKGLRVTPCVEILTLTH